MQFMCLFLYSIFSVENKTKMKTGKLNPPIFTNMRKLFTHLNKKKLFHKNLADIFNALTLPVFFLLKVVVLVLKY